jgi:hypothetical protein
MAILAITQKMLGLIQMKKVIFSGKCVNVPRLRFFSMFLVILVAASGCDFNTFMVMLRPSNGATGAHSG